MNKKNNLYSNNIEITKILEQYKNNKKIYLRLLEVLDLVGNFNNKIDVEIYEIIDNENEKSIKLWCSDMDENIFVFCPISTLKKELNMIEKITNEGTTIYDLSLCKKYELTKDNIDLIKTKNVYNFKFGRLITDEKSFYNIFLGNDSCYSIEIKFLNRETISAHNLLIHLNKFENVPTFSEYVKLFENLLNINDFQEATLSVYKNFARNSNIRIDNSIEYQKKKIIK